MPQQRPSRRALVVLPSLSLTLALGLFAAQPAAAHESASWWPTWDRLIGWFLPIEWTAPTAPRAATERVLITIDPNGLDLESPDQQLFRTTEVPDHSPDAAN